MSPEALLFRRYGVMAVLAMIALVIGSRSFPSVVFGWIVAGASAIGTRIVVTAPGRFALRNATVRLRRVFYLFIAEIVALGVAFTLIFDQRGSPAIAIAALVVVIVLEVLATRTQIAEYRRLHVIIDPIAHPSPDEVSGFAPDAGGPSSRAFQSALADAFVQIPTVVRAYLVISDTGRRTLSLRFAYPWVDESAVRAARIVARQMFGNDPLDLIELDARSETRLRTVTMPFYERAQRTALAPASTSP
jgi:hypothetical protein